MQVPGSENAGPGSDILGLELMSEEIMQVPGSDNAGPWKW